VRETGAQTAGLTPIGHNGAEAVYVERTPPSFWFDSTRKQEPVSSYISADAADPSRLMVQRFESAEARRAAHEFVKLNGRHKPAALALQRLLSSSHACAASLMIAVTASGRDT
jgi:hypothetical protein